MKSVELCPFILAEYLAPKLVSLICQLHYVHAIIFSMRNFTIVSLVSPYFFHQKKILNKIITNKHQFLKLVLLEFNNFLVVWKLFSDYNMHSPVYTEWAKFCPHLKPCSPIQVKRGQNLVCVYSKANKNEIPLFWDSLKFSVLMWWNKNSNSILMEKDSPKAQPTRKILKCWLGIKQHSDVL